MTMIDKKASGRLKEYPEICRLMNTAFPRNEQMPMWLLKILAFRKSVNFRAFYEDEQFCGILYTAEDDKAQGQAYAGIAMTFGNVLATFSGGRIIDAFGVDTMLIVGTVISALGTVILWVFLEDSRHSEVKDYIQREEIIYERTL